MAQAPDQTTGSRARRTPFSDMAEQLYPEQGQTDPATEDVQNGEDFDGGAPNDTSGDAGNSGESPVHPAGHGLGQALEDALFWNAKGQPDAQGSSPASSAPAPAGESQPGRIAPAATS